jgi:transcriptional regulator with GAF, ATPase, and Fis domain
MPPKNALSNLIELASNVADAYTTALYAVDLEKGTLTLRSHLTLSSHLKTDDVFTIGEGLLGEVALSKEPCIEDFARTDAAPLEWYTKTENIKGLMVVPVVRKELEGVLVVDSKENYSFTPKLQKLITGFADQMAWYLSLEKKNSNWIDGEPSDFQQMMKWCRFLGDAPHRKALSERFLHIPKSLIHCDATAVIWFESEGTGRITHSKGWGQGLKTLTIESGSGLCGTCLDNGQPMLVRNTMNRSWTIFSDDEAPQTFGSLMVAPIASDKRMLGLVVCATRAANGLKQPEMDKLILMTTLAASSLGQINSSSPTSDLILREDENTGPASQYFAPIHIKAFESEIIERNAPVSLISIRLRNAGSLFREKRRERADMLLDQISMYLSGEISPLKLFMKRSDEGLIVLLISVNEQDAYELEESIQDALSRISFSLEGSPIHVEFDFGQSLFPSDGRDLEQLIDISWNRALHAEEQAHG